MHDIQTDEMRGEDGDEDRLEFGELYKIDDQIIDERERLGMLDYYTNLLAPLKPDDEGLP